MVVTKENGVGVVLKSFVLWDAIATKIMPGISKKDAKSESLSFLIPGTM